MISESKKIHTLKFLEGLLHNFDKKRFVLNYKSDNYLIKKCFQIPILLIIRQNSKHYEEQIYKSCQM